MLYYITTLEKSLVQTDIFGLKWQLLSHISQYFLCMYNMAIPVVEQDFLSGQDFG